MRAVVFGYGAIGREIACKLKAFDVHVVAVNRTGTTTDQPLVEPENVLISCHVAGAGGRSMEHFARLLTENIHRYQAKTSEPLLNEVDCR